MPTTFCFAPSSSNTECTEESLSCGAGLPKDALAIDPSYAPAMALAAYCYAGGSIQGWSHDVRTTRKRGFVSHCARSSYGKDDGNVLWMAAYAVRRLGRGCARAHESSPIARWP